MTNEETANGGEKAAEGRKARLAQILEEDFSGYDFAEWRSAEGRLRRNAEEPSRFAHVSDTGTYAWVDFAERLEDFDDFFDEGFEPVAVLDLDTGERYSPVLRWRKVELVEAPPERGEPVQRERAAGSGEECPEGGEHEWSPDVEYDASGATVNCEKCGAPAPGGTGA